MARNVSRIRAASPRVAPSEAMSLGNGREPGPPRHFLDIDRHETAELRHMLDLGFAYKNGRRDRPLDGKTLAMIFEKPSTRTRVSFEVAMRQLGGDVIMLDTAGSQLGRGETIADTARVLSRYVDAIMIRTNHAEKLDELARQRHRAGDQRSDRRIASVPDHGRCDDACRKRRGRSPTRSWPGAATATTSRSAGCMPRHGSVSSCGWPAPTGFARRSRSSTGLGARAPGSASCASRSEAVAGADCVVTDTWVSMGADGSVNRHNLLAPYRVDEGLMAKAKPDAIFMHCLPAKRGEEVTAGVIDGPQSVVWDEAENRLHAQKGILAWCLA